MPSNPEALRLRALAGGDTPLTEAEFNLLLQATENALDEHIERIFGPEPEYISEADFQVLLAAANKQIDDFIYRHTGKLPE